MNRTVTCRARRIGPPVWSALYILVLSAWSAPRTGLARAAPPDSSVYHVSGGRSTLERRAGQRVLRMANGVTIVHGDVTITGQTGVHYLKRRHVIIVNDVVIHQGTLTMWGNRGSYHEPTRVATLVGNVRIRDRGWTVTADSLEYARITDRAWLRGHVVAVDSSSTLRADSLFYDRRSGSAEAFGKVTLRDRKRGFVVTGTHGWYFRDRHHGVVDRLPHLVVDPDSDEPVIVDSDTMVVYPDSNMAVAYYRVKIIKGVTVTQCDSAVVYDRKNRADLFGKPLARQNNTSMKSDRMSIYFNHREVDRIDLMGSGLIVETNRDSLVLDRDSHVQGDTIRMYIRNADVDSMRVLGNAESEYFPTTPGKVERNLAHGDRMFFQFENDSLVYVRIDGKADGVYRYVNIFPGETTDTLRALADTSLTYRSFDENAEKVVYSGKKIEYYAHTNDLVLSRHATLDYRGNLLKGKYITYYSRYDLLDATGDPVLTEDAQTFYGTRMNYDLDGRTGLVENGSTKFNDGFYTGKTVAKVGDGEMKVWHSTYTTCDLAKPHYHFRAKEMKVFPGDKVVSGPVWLYVGQTPVFYLPFMASNIEKGRRSGFLRPDFDVGVTSSSGRFVRNIGYYWAPNDYYDVTTLADFNEKRNLRLFTQGRYKLRYRFDGKIEYNLERDLSSFSNHWEVRWQHNQQQLPGGVQLRADAHYVSDDTAPQRINRIDNVDRVTDRRIESNLAVTKAFSPSVRLNATARRVHNLSLDNPASTKLDMTVPQVTLSIPSRTLFFGQKSQSGHAGIWERVLSSVRYAPTLNGNHRITESDIDYRAVTTINSGLGISSTPKFGFLSLSPGIRLTGRTVRTDHQQLSHVVPTDSVPLVTPFLQTTSTTTDVQWSASTSARTNMYGTFYTKIGKLRGIRHAISPSVSYSYTPPHQNAPQNQSVNVSLRNTLDLKVAAGDSVRGANGELQEKVRKLNNVLIWTLSSRYDPDLPWNRAWQNVSSQVGAQVFGMNVTWNQSIDPYRWDIINQNASARVSFRGSHPFGRTVVKTERKKNVVARHDTSSVDSSAASQVDIVQTGSLPANSAGPSTVELEKGRLPWTLSLDGSYSKSRGAEARSSIRMFTQFNITAGWKVNYSMIYDITARRQSGQNISVTRDLHCWQMSFSRQKLGDEWQFYFRLSIKALPEIYTEAGRRGVGGGRLGTGSFF